MEYAQVVLIHVDQHWEEVEEVRGEVASESGSGQGHRRFGSRVQPGSDTTRTSLPLDLHRLNPPEQGQGHGKGSDKRRKRDPGQSEALMGGRTKVNGCKGWETEERQRAVGVAGKRVWEG
eukprot:3261847-Rhodomonas_salina.1